MGAIAVGAFFSLIFLGIGAVLVLIFSIYWRYKIHKMQKEAEKAQWQEAEKYLNDENAPSSTIIEGEFRREE